MGRRKKHQSKVEFKNQCENSMATPIKVDITFDDGSVQTVSAAPVVAPTDTEVDVLMSDGSTKKFVPAA